MIEKTFVLEDINPVDFFGLDNSTIKLLQDKYPKLRIIARGDEIKVSGEADEIADLESKLNLLFQVFRKQPNVSRRNIEEILKVVKMNGQELEAISAGEESVLVHGPNGRIVRARTPNQQKMVQFVEENDIVFAIGPAGTGKTYTAVALAVRALKNKEIRRIILARPAVEAGENLGFLPGDLKEKIDPYLRPLYDALDDMIPAEKLKVYLETRVIEVAPMAFMRGRTLDNCFVILDEAQNATNMQLKMFLTRMGPNAKVIVTGDLTQIDLPKKQQSGLLKAVKILDKIKGIKIAYLTVEDVVRHKLVKEIIKAYDAYSDKTE